MSAGSTKWCVCALKFLYAFSILLKRTKCSARLIIPLSDEPNAITSYLALHYVNVLVVSLFPVWNTTASCLLETGQLFEAWSTCNAVVTYRVECKETDSGGTYRCVCVCVCVLLLAYSCIGQ
jgi:hypothetical protein